MSKFCWVEKPSLACYLTSQLLFFVFQVTYIIFRFTFFNFNSSWFSWVSQLLASASCSSHMQCIWTQTACSALVCQIPSLRADVSYFLPPAEKGHLRNGVANRVPISCCFSGIRGKCFYWLLDNSHC